MIVLKIILMTLLAVLPFLFSRCVKGKGTLSSMVIKGIPLAGKAAHKAAVFAKRLHEGMKRFDSFRKFFHMMLIILMLALTYTDFAATDEAARRITEMAQDDPTYLTRRADLQAFMSHPFILMGCLVLNLSLFSYRWADRLLTRLHQSRELQVILAVTCLLISAVSALNDMRYFILTEVLYLLVIMSWAYPDRIGSPGPKGRKPIDRAMEPGSEKSVKIAA